MIRPTEESDHDALISLANESGLFELDQTDVLVEMLKSPSETDVWFTDIDGSNVKGVEYVAPEKRTSGTWALYWIAIAPQFQRNGRGSAIVEHVVSWIKTHGARVLLVETAGTEEFDYVRRSYQSHGSDEEARIRYFYEEGIDKVVFRRPLAARGATI